MKSFAGSWLAGVGLLIAWGVVVQTPGGVTAQTLSPALDRARNEPIVDGKAAGGVQLGELQQAVIKRFGGLPAKIESFEAGARQDFLYVGADPAGQWALVLGIVFRQERVHAISIVVSRRPPEPFPYGGATSRGYRIGEPVERLRALYGSPDAVMPDRGPQIVTVQDLFRPERA
ncbi:MAG: hypothetical protein ACRD0W_21685 [Acidimicrobiales bacterium]